MKPIGFFSEMNLYEDNGPLIDNIVEKVNYDKEMVVKYLESFDTQAICARGPIDCGTGEKIANGFRVINDGEYEWCDFLTYHIRKYEIKLPKSFLRKIMAGTR